MVAVAQYLAAADPNMVLVETYTVAVDNNLYSSADHMDFVDNKVDYMVLLVMNFFSCNKEHNK
jgi:hypothetical protein